ncbi:MAG: hypothetical protein V7767_03205, partial [Leeuwenhoekiella sp.]
KKVMKKKLKSELVSLAHRILNLDSESNYIEMQEEARRLYEAFTILAFAEKQFDTPKFGTEKQENVASIKEELEEIIEKEEKVIKEEEVTADLFEELEEPELKTQDNLDRVAEIARANEKLFEKARKKPEKREEKDSFYRPDGTEINENDEPLYEPVIEKIKDMVAQMPSEADDIDEIFHQITGKPEYIKNDMNDVGEFGRMPEFEKKQDQHEIKVRSLNDRLTKSVAIGLNDRIAFIKHLFNGSASDYNRVLSQLNTISTKSEAVSFINSMVKPDYNNWQGKEIYENRFIEQVEKKFDN